MLSEAERNDARGVEWGGTGEPRPQQACSSLRAALCSGVPLSLSSTFSCSELMQHILPCAASRFLHTASHPSRGTLEKLFSQTHSYLVVLSSNCLDLQVHGNISCVTDTSRKFIVRLIVGLLIIVVLDTVC